MADPDVPPSTSSPDAEALARDLSPVEVAVSDVVGRLMEFWGFKRNMGRVWSVLYLSPDPLSAEDLRHLLRLSSGAVSMTLSELSHWGVVRKVWLPGERKDFFVAEVHLWKMISRVFGERERVEIVSAVEALEGALRTLDRVGPVSDTSSSARLALQKERVKKLLDVAKLGQGLLDVLLSTAKLDAGPLTRFLLARRPGDDA